MGGTKLSSRGCWYTVPLSEKLDESAARGLGRELTSNDGRERLITYSFAAGKKRDAADSYLRFTLISDFVVFKTVQFH